MKKESGQGVVEMAFILVLVALVIVLMLAVAGPAVQTTAQNLGNEINKAADRAVGGGNLPELSPHALEHDEAQEAYNWLQAQASLDHCKWDCGNRTRYACWDGEHWAFAVVEGARTITVFYSNQEYAVEHTRDDPGCKNPFHPAHP